MKIIGLYTVALLAALYALAALTSCSATTTIPQIHPTITLPASGDGFWVSTVATPQGPNEGTIPKAQWEIQRKRTIDLSSDDWQVLRTFLIRNCLTQACKYMVGTFDTLFYTIDEALKKMQSLPIPGPKP